MAQVLQTNLLSRSVGFPVKNHKGKSIGKIAEVIGGRDQITIEYVILQSKILHGKKDRFFAIPASSALIKITTGGRIVLQIYKDELQNAKGLTIDKCPKPMFRFEPIIFELYHYNQTQSQEY